MENRNSRPKLDRLKTTAYIRRTLGTRQSSFRKSLAYFALDTAKLTEQVFRSRFRPGAEILDPSIEIDAEVLWHTAGLSITQLYGGVPFEEIVRESHIEIAGDAYLLNPDIRLPVDQRVPRYTNQLYSASNKIRVAALTRVMSQILMLTECLDYTDLSEEQIFEMAWLHREFKVFSQWSIKTTELYDSCGDIINSWYTQGFIPRKLPKPSLYFALDGNARLNELKQLFEDT